MSLFVNRDIKFLGASDLIPRRSALGQSNTYVSMDDALRTSAVWAALRLRADLVSTMPVDTYRRIDGRQVEMPNSAVLQNPDGGPGGMPAWLYSTQFDLDRYGNDYGVIRARSGDGKPMVIELQSGAGVIVRGNGPNVTEYQIGGQIYQPQDIWHERQFTLPGIPVGLSPIGFAALSINQHLNAQTFIADWFGGAAVPKSRLRNKAKRVDPGEAIEIRDRYLSMITNGGLFVHGNDWEFDTVQSAAADISFLETMHASDSDVCRFLGVPADILDVASQNKSSVTYANVTQRNLQLLIMNLGPSIIRREYALSTLTPAPRYVKLNSDALLRMDTTGRAEVTKLKIDSRVLAPSEARELDDRPPFTEDQYAEFDRLFGAKTAPGTKTGVPV